MAGGVLAKTSAGYTDAANVTSVVTPPAPAAAKVKPALAIPDLSKQLMAVGPMPAHGDYPKDELPLKYHLWGIALAGAIYSSLGLDKSLPSEVIKALKKHPEVIVAIAQKYGDDWLDKYADAYLIHKIESGTGNGVKKKKVGPGDKWMAGVYTPSYWEDYEKLKEGGMEIGQVKSLHISMQPPEPGDEYVDAPTLAPITKTPPNADVVIKLGKTGKKSTPDMTVTMADIPPPGADQTPVAVGDASAAPTSDTTIGKAWSGTPATVDVEALHAEVAAILAKADISDAPALAGTHWDAELKAKYGPAWLNSVYGPYDKVDDDTKAVEAINLKAAHNLVAVQAWADALGIQDQAQKDYLAALASTPNDYYAAADVIAHQHNIGIHWATTLMKKMVKKLEDAGFVTNVQPSGGGLFSLTMKSHDAASGYALQKLGELAKTPKFKELEEVGGISEKPGAKIALAALMASKNITQAKDFGVNVQVPGWEASTITSLFHNLKEKGFLTGTEDDYELVTKKKPTVNADFFDSVWAKLGISNPAKSPDEAELKDAIVYLLKDKEQDFSSAAADFTKTHPDMPLDVAGTLFDKAYMVLMHGGIVSAKSGKPSFSQYDVKHPDDWVLGAQSFPDALAAVPEAQVAAYAKAAEKQGYSVTLAQKKAIKALIATGGDMKAALSIVGATLHVDPFEVFGMVTPGLLKAGVITATGNGNFALSPVNVAQPEDGKASPVWNYVTSAAKINTGSEDPDEQDYSNAIALLLATGDAEDATAALSGSLTHVGADAAKILNMVVADLKQLHLIRTEGSKVAFPKVDANAVMSAMGYPDDENETPESSWKKRAIRALALYGSVSAATLALNSVNGATPQDAQKYVIAALEDLSDSGAAKAAGDTVTLLPPDAWVMPPEPVAPPIMVAKALPNSAYENTVYSKMKVRALGYLLKHKSVEKAANAMLLALKKEGVETEIGKVIAPMMDAAMGLAAAGLFTLDHKPGPNGSLDTILSPPKGPLAPIDKPANLSAGTKAVNAMMADSGATADVLANDPDASAFLASQHGPNWYSLWQKEMGATASAAPTVADQMVAAAQDPIVKGLGTYIEPKDLHTTQKSLELALAALKATGSVSAAQKVAGQIITKKVVNYLKDQGYGYVAGDSFAFNPLTAPTAEGMTAKIKQAFTEPLVQAALKKLGVNPDSPTGWAIAALHVSGGNISQAGDYLKLTGKTLAAAGVIATILGKANAMGASSPLQVDAATLSAKFVEPKEEAPKADPSPVLSYLSPAGWLNGKGVYIGLSDILNAPPVLAQIEKKAGPNWLMDFLKAYGHDSKVNTAELANGIAFAAKKGLVATVQMQGGEVLSDPKDIAKSSSPAWNATMNLAFGNGWAARYSKLVAAIPSDPVKAAELLTMVKQAATPLVGMDPVTDDTIDKLAASPSFNQAMKTKFPSWQDGAKALIGGAKASPAVSFAAAAEDEGQKAQLTAGWAFPETQHLKNAGNAKGLGGNKPKVFLDGPDGTRYLGKPQTGTEQRAYASQSASELLSELLDDGEYIPVKAMTLPGGQFGTVQPFYADATNLEGADLESLTSAQVADLVKARAATWLLSEHDAHKAQFLKLKSGKLLHADIEQAGKFVGDDKLDLTYEPNEHAPIFNELFTLWTDGKLKLNPADMASVLDRADAMSESEWTAKWQPYIDARAKASGETASAIKTKLLARKKSARADLEGFITSALIARKELKEGQKYTFPKATKKIKKGKSIGGDPLALAVAAGKPPADLKPTKAAGFGWANGLGTVVTSKAGTYLHVPGTPAEITSGLAAASIEQLFVDSSNGAVVADVGGKPGLLWRVDPIHDSEAPLTPANAKKVTAAMVPMVVQQHMADWVAGRAGSDKLLHEAGFLIRPEVPALGDVDATFEGSVTGVTKAFWDAFASGDLSFEPATAFGSLFSSTSKMQSSVTTLRDRLKPAAVAAFPTDNLAQQAFIQKGVNRYIAAKQKFEAFIGKQYVAREGTEGSFTFKGGWKPSGVSKPKKKDAPIPKTVTLTKAKSEWAAEAGIYTKPHKTDPKLIALKVGQHQKAVLDKFLSDHELKSAPPVKTGDHNAIAIVTKKAFDEPFAKEVPNPALNVPKEDPKVAGIADYSGNATYFPTQAAFGEAALSSEVLKKPAKESKEVFGPAGMAFHLGGLNVESNSARIKKIRRPNGTMKVLISFKYRGTPWKGGVEEEFEFPHGKYSPDSDAIEQKGTAFSLTTNTWHVGKDSIHFGKGDYSYRGAVYAEMEYEPGQNWKEKLGALLDATKVKGLAKNILHDPTEAEILQHKKAALMWSYTPQLSDSLGTVPSDAQVDSAFAGAKGIPAGALDQVVEAQVAPGVTGLMLPGRWKDLGGGKPGAPAAKFVFVGVSTPKNIVNMTNTGVTCAVDRILNGLANEGTSVGDDMETGGADYAMFRLMTQGTLGQSMTPGVSGSYQVVIAPDVLDRLDIALHPGDKYGCTNPSHSSYGNHWKNRKSLTKAIEGHSGGNAELIIKRAVDPAKILRVVTDSEAYRKTLIQAYKAEGITEVNSVPIEDFVAVEDDSNAVYSKFVQPLGY